MISRADYMRGKLTPETHRRYYGQFVNADTIAHVVAAIGLDRLKASTDPHFNDIPLGEWDRAAGQATNLRYGTPPKGHCKTCTCHKPDPLPKRPPIALRFRDVDKGGGSMADWTCIVKEAARQAVESATA